MKLYLAFVVLLVSCHNRGPIRVGIQPLGNVDSTVTRAVLKTINQTFAAEVHLLPSQPPPASAFTNIKTPRYRADRIIEKFKKEKPVSLDYVIVVTELDISVTKRDALGNIKKPQNKYEDWGVFGYGYRPGPSCVISSFRLKNPPSKTKRRLEKVALHELGHNLGLPHCSDEECVMQDAAETIQTIDKIDGAFCENCRHKINSALRK
jgi:archaemetzincin